MTITYSKPITKNKTMTRKIIPNAIIDADTESSSIEKWEMNEETGIPSESGDSSGEENK